jgi:host factor-I protein
MQSFLESRTPILDTSLPSVRHIQGLIRQKTPVALRLLDGHELEGVLLWQDIDQLALDPGEGRALNLVNRHAVAVLRSLA